MPFQKTINRELAIGIPGEVANNGPRRAVTATLNSTDAKNNVFGRVFTYTADHEVAAGKGNGGAIAGILSNPKAYALYGTDGNTVGPSMALPNGGDAEFTYMAEMYVVLPRAAAIGDKVIYDETTGEIDTVARAATDPGAGKAFLPNAYVSNFYTTGNSIGVITLTN
ncbi:hypothetical protein LPW36_01995 [Jinshanibacter sp. LJY008]|uniref:Uncharacterized protein n=1 Tax=Limnobaculum eriocheiris TaxID=2897391 RepID=A0A9X1MSQ5_9GAMM|nr:hypothetical protein [Limnobaculum eriocheiris]MCD1124816.1 hypothetical protein [Limnobaculum eriocheiris]